MEPAQPSSRLIRFGAFELDLRSGELRKQGRKIRLEGQPVQVLICLLENPGELVTREELHRKLWSADTFVNFEHGLNAAVKRLRQALNDSADNPRFVETLPRRGYRFIAPVQVAAAVVEAPAGGIPATGFLASGLVATGVVATGLAAPTDVSEAGNHDPADLSEKVEVPVRGRWTHAWKWSTLALLVALGILAVRMLRPGKHRPSVIRSLAVLPLENLSGDASQDYFSDGMTDALITELGQIGELRVISRTSVMIYKGAHRSLPAIARDLSVDAVVEGAVLRSGDRVRITAQLILAADDKHLWAQSYNGDLRDTLALQKQVAREIAAEIRIELTPHEQAVLKNAPRVNPDAYEAYLRGRYFWNKRTAEGLKRAIDYFNQAIKNDPNYAPAYVGLTDSYALAGDWQYGVLAPKEAYPKAKAAAAKAIALDSTFGEAHISLAWCLDGFEWDWESAGREFTRGIELSPGYATGHHWYGWHLAALGRHDEAVAELKKAENMDPLSLVIGTDLAEELLIAHRYDEAINQSRKTMNMDPFFALTHYVLGEVFVQKRMYSEAIAEFQKAIELSPGSTAFKAHLAYAYAVSGKRDKAVTILNDLKNRSHDAVSNPCIALIYVGLNEKDQAMAWLEKAYVERFNPGVLMRPAFDPLRPDPRFQNLLRRIGLNR
jgi:TolB-like protein/DNA-binding winged helix-turn-helix (wHTH) protein/predicted negative regulator of RcsB-dependent stress response